MALMDKMKAQAQQLAQKAQEAGKAGQAKMEDAKARRAADGVLRELGAVVYAQRTGTAPANSDAEVDRLVAEVKKFETEHGPIGAAAPATDGDAPVDGESSSEPETPPEGGFKL